MSGAEVRSTEASARLAVRWKLNGAARVITIRSKFAPDISGIALLVLGRLVLRRHHRVSVCCDRESKIFDGLVPGIIQEVLNSFLRIEFDDHDPACGFTLMRFDDQNR